MEDLFCFVDELGPAKIVHVCEPSIGLKAVLVVDNVARGPAIGGVRMATDVTTQECVRLARAMTFKNAAAGLPHGGGKVVLRGDPNMPADRKQQLIRALAQLLRGEQEYIFAPDMGTNEECMAWVKDEISRVVALPRDIGGIPLDEIGATGWGLSHVVDVALHYCDFELEAARVVVQGFGAVGRHAARFLTAKGARLVAVADSRGATHNPAGLDLNALFEMKAAGRSVVEYADGTPLESDAIIDVECDIWIPAARPDVVNEDNVHRLKTRLVVEGANIPFTPGAEEYLHERGVLCIPDFIANAGGVICAAMEYHGATQAAALQSIEEKLRANTEQVMQTSKSKLIMPRQAAIEMAEQRVRKAMGFRRFSLVSTAPDYT
jgi:glutamate dehydrogenase (NAD(P)+)